MTSVDTDVLVVGAGPTGLTLAVVLAQLGVRCRVIDQSATPFTIPRALGIQARTLEIFSMIGIADRILAEAHTTTGTTFYVGGRTISWDFGPITRELGVFALGAGLPQTQVEQFLTDLAESKGLRLERGVALAGVHQQDDLVVARVTGPSGEQEIPARWLVGCDGAHSTTRKALGVDFEGRTYPIGLVHADVAIDWDRSRDHFYRWIHPDGRAQPN